MINKAKVFKDGQLIDQGFYMGGSKWNKDHPEQDVILSDSQKDLTTQRFYTHGEGITFKIYDSFGDVIYDSDAKWGV